MSGRSDRKPPAGRRTRTPSALPVERGGRGTQRQPVRRLALGDCNAAPLCRQPLVSSLSAPHSARSAAERLTRQLTASRALSSALGTRLHRRAATQRGLDPAQPTASPLGTPTVPPHRTILL